MSQAATTLEALRKPEPTAVVEVGFSTSDSYALMRKIAVDFAASDLVPQRYQGKAPNCMIALNMALRMRADPLMVMQNLYVVHGTPAWSASFLIACFNQCGRFAPIAYKFEGKRDADDWGCRAVSSYLADGTPVEGPLVTIGIAKAEGWFAKNGSKWKTMPEQMLRYRAAAWMIRSTAPEIGMGFQTTEEAHDTYEMQKGDDGTFSVSLSDMKSAHAEEVAPEPKTTEQDQPAEQTAQRTRPTAEEMDTRRSTALEVWLQSGGTKEDAEKLVNNFAHKWTSAQCAKVEEAARRILAEKMQKAADEVFPTQPEGDSIPCPMEQGEQTYVTTCLKCPESNGCTEFKKYVASQQ